MIEYTWQPMSTAPKERPFIGHFYDRDNAVMHKMIWSTDHNKFIVADPDLVDRYAKQWPYTQLQAWMECPTDGEWKPMDTYNWDTDGEVLVKYNDDTVRLCGELCNDEEEFKQGYRHSWRSSVSQDMLDECGALGWFSPPWYDDAYNVEERD